MGKDVPASGVVWVVPADGTVVRTRLEFRNFADEETDPGPGGVRVDTTVPPSSARSGSEKYAPGPSGPLVNTPTARRFESLAVVEVTYRLDKQTRVWLPLKMSESYEGAVLAMGGHFLPGRATGVAEYSDFKQFQTSAKVVAPK